MPKYPVIHIFIYKYYFACIARDLRSLMVKNAGVVLLPACLVIGP